MKIDENTAIKCNNIEEVRDCFNKLEELGFAFKDDYSFEDRFLVFYSTYEKAFLNNVHFYISKDHNYINYKNFLKLYNKQIKEKQPDLLVDKNGKVLKVNNINKEYDVFYYNTNSDEINEIDFSGSFLAVDIKKIDFYTSLEACEKALKRKETENKLRMVAETLNNQVQHMYSLFETNVPKYSISIEYTRFLETKLHCCMCGNNFIKNQGTIYCYSKDFLNKALELIGEEDLKDFLINY